MAQECSLEVNLHTVPIYRALFHNTEGPHSAWSQFFWGEIQTKAVLWEFTTHALTAHRYTDHWTKPELVQSKSPRMVTAGMTLSSSLQSCCY